MKEENMSTFKKNCANLVIENSGWGKQVQMQIDEIEMMFTKIMGVAREKEITKLHNLTKKAFYETAEEIINEPIYKLEDNFWAKIREPFQSELYLVIENCLQILNKGFNSQPQEDEEFIENFTADSKTYAQDFIKRLFKDINTNLLRRFNQEFKMDENRKERNWVVMEEHAIDELWGKCRANVEHIFKDFRYIEIHFDYKTINESHNMTAGGSATPGGDDQIMEEKARMRTGSLVYSKLLSEQDINKIKDKFQEDINNQLEEAKRKHVSIHFTLFYFCSTT